jgi:hypothetical protein
MFGRHLTRKAVDIDERMHSGTFNDELPAAQSALDMLLNASTSPDIRRKRSASCPARLNKFSLDNLAARLEDLSLVLPHSDPIEASATPLVPTRALKRRAGQQGVSGITVENAQTLLDPEACLFVAK